MRLKRRTLLAILILLVSLFVASLSLTYSSNPQVILVHTQNSPYPDVAFRLSSLPLAISTFLKTGDRIFAVLPASHENVEMAFSKGKAVIVGTHGIDGGIVTDDGFWIGPKSKTNPHMKLIYFGSCYFGEKRSRWQAMFPDAKLIGYDQITSPLVGWRYLALQSWWDVWAVDWR